MELLTVVVIIGILASIAIPSYRQYTLRANRAEAKTNLLFYASALERCYTRYNDYRYNSNSTLGCPVLSAATNSENGMYQIATDNRTATTYRLTATPLGKQANDTGCGTLKIDQLNNRTITGTKTPSECWGK
jgi:type IV pilus assembly protein PilE